MQAGYQSGCAELVRWPTERTKGLAADATECGLESYTTPVWPTECTVGADSRTDSHEKEIDGRQPDSAE